jgi:hypothetical protein
LWVRYTCSEARFLNFAIALRHSRGRTHGDGTEIVMRISGWSIGYRRRIRVAACVAASALLLSQPCALAQSAVPPPDERPLAAPAPKRGFLDAVGRWFDEGASNFRDHLRGAKRRVDTLNEEAAANTRQLNERAAEVGKGAAEVGKGAAEATKSALDAVTKLPTARVVQGRERCATAPNGAPDCLAAAELLCRKNGYATGKSMDFTSAEQCPPRVLLGQASPDQCETVTFISRAMCQ